MILNIEETKALIVKAFSNRNIPVVLDVKEKNNLYFLMVDLPEEGVDDYERKYAAAFMAIREPLEPFWNRSEDHFSATDKMLLIWLKKQA